MAGQSEREIKRADACASDEWATPDGGEQHNNPVHALTQTN